ncbi:MAG: aminodeoxychorismate lyase [Pseudomonadota bacterium]
MSWLFDPPTATTGPDSRAMAYGDGVFTTAAVRSGAILFRERHIERLQHGCERLAIEPPGQGRIDQLLSRSLSHGTAAAMLKIMAFRAGSKRGYRPSEQDAAILAARCYPLDGVDEWPDLAPLRLGLAALRWAVQPALAGLKHLNRLEQVLAAAEIRSTDDVLCCDTSGQVVSASSANVFAVIDGELLTPPLDTAGVTGVTRAAVSAICRRDAIALRVEPLTHDDLVRCSEMFLTSSRFGIRPVGNHAGRALPIGPVTRDLHRRLLRETPLCAG